MPLTAGHNAALNDLRVRLERTAGVRPSLRWLQDCYQALQQQQRPPHGDAETADSVLEQILHHDLRDVVRQVQPSNDDPARRRNNDNNNAEQQQHQQHLLPAPIQLRQAMLSSIATMAIANAGSNAQIGPVANSRQQQQYAKAVLPESFRLMVQVEESWDVSVPTEIRLASSSGSLKRCLKMIVSDGYEETNGLTWVPSHPTAHDDVATAMSTDRVLVAMEVTPISGLSAHSPAGIKLLLAGPLEIRHGIVLLHPGHCLVLGGRGGDRLVERQRAAWEQAHRRAGIGVDPTILALIGTSSSLQDDPDSEDNPEEEQGDHESGDVVIPLPPPPQPVQALVVAAAAAPPPQVTPASATTSTFLSGRNHLPPFHSNSVQGDGTVVRNHRGSDHSQEQQPMSMSTSAPLLRPGMTTTMLSTLRSVGSPEFASTQQLTTVNPYARVGVARSVPTLSQPAPVPAHPPSIPSLPIDADETIELLDEDEDEAPTMRQPQQIVHSSMALTESTVPVRANTAMDAGFRTSAVAHSNLPIDLPISAPEEFSSNMDAHTSLTTLADLCQLIQRALQDQSVYQAWYQGQSAHKVQLQQHGPKLYFNIEKRTKKKGIKSDGNSQSSNKYEYVMSAKFRGPKDDNNEASITCRLASEVLEPHFALSPDDMRKLNKSERSRANDLVREGGLSVQQQTSELITYAATLWLPPEGVFVAGTGQSHITALDGDQTLILLSPANVELDAQSCGME